MEVRHEPNFGNPVAVVQPHCRTRGQRVRAAKVRGIAPCFPQPRQDARLLQKARRRGQPKAEVCLVVDEALAAIRLQEYK